MDFGQISANLGFDWRVALANLANFLVIVWILKRFAFKPIEKTVTEARSRANIIIATAQKESEKIISESKTLKEEQAKQIVAEANKMIQQEKQKMLGDLKNELADLVIATTKKFLKEDMTKEKQEEIIKKLIK